MPHRSLTLGLLRARVLELLDRPLCHLPLFVERLPPLPLPIQVDGLAHPVELLALRREVARVPVILSRTVELAHPTGLARVLHDAVREGESDGLVDAQDVGDVV